jgi:hypothetical protein
MDQSVKAWFRGCNRMRLWHFALVILVLGSLLAIVRDPMERITLIVFATALGEAVIRTKIVMIRFRSTGALGMA